MSVPFPAHLPHNFDILFLEERYMSFPVCNNSYRNTILLHRGLKASIPLL